MVIGTRHSQALVTINERKNRYTLTTDNGKELAQHERIAAELNYFFAHPHTAWERVANENRNDLLCQVFPQHRKLEEVTDEEIALASTA